MRGPQQTSLQRHGKAVRPRRFRQRRFTLVELLVVLVITGIMFSLVVAPFDAMMGSTGVDGGARMVASQLRLARQYAISHRKRVAVLFPMDQGSDEERKFTAFRSCEVDSSGQWVDWIDNTKWEYLPAGTIIRDVDATQGATTPVTEPVTVTDVDGVAADDFRAVIFKPNGAITYGSGHLYVYVVEGYFDPSLTPPLRIVRDDNAQELEIGQYTGRITFE